MADTEEPKGKPVRQVGAVAPNLHEGSRSEYLAQFVFSSFGTSVPVPHQEDTGLDLYCTLLERIDQRAWPRAYYSVQVKSTLDPWVFASAESVRWLIEHPLPIFLCVVQKSEARILVYNTTPRFAAWIHPEHPDRLEVIPETNTKSEVVEWGQGSRYYLKAPILNFTIQQILDAAFRERAAQVLKFWIDFDLENLLRIRCGIHAVLLPADYVTNETTFGAWVRYGGQFRKDSLNLALDHLKELLSTTADHYCRANDIEGMAILLMALRHLSPESRPNPKEFSPAYLNHKLNYMLGMNPSTHMFQASDSLLKLVKVKIAELSELSARVADTSPSERK